ncbi:hypothetical protein RRG08_038559 [Elysia crispata]|uniref:Uncharacterized protein n=1 Tax=Elysia crispata TaxID=231223 RepID=A0AAE1CYK2_9GAST|nr:hypothetical protein RRG08_038559 [Elysia crispata]
MYLEKVDAVKHKSPRNRWNMRGEWTWNINIRFGWMAEKMSLTSGEFRAVVQSSNRAGVLRFLFCFLGFACRFFKPLDSVRGQRAVCKRWRSDARVPERVLAVWAGLTRKLPGSVTGLGVSTQLPVSELWDGKLWENSRLEKPRVDPAI